MKIYGLDINVGVEGVLVEEDRTTCKVSHIKTFMQDSFGVTTLEMRLSMDFFVIIKKSRNCSPNSVFHRDFFLCVRLKVLVPTIGLCPRMY